MIEFWQRAISIVLAVILSFKLYPTKRWPGGVLSAILCAFFLSLAHGAVNLSVILGGGTILGLVLADLWKNRV